MTAKKKVIKKRAVKAEKKKAGNPDLVVVEDIISIMDKAGLVEIEYERKGLFIGLRRSEGGGGVAPVASASVVPVAKAESAKQERPSNLVPIISPMVGTFYRAPSPEAAPFAEVGGEVKPDSVVCIVEAMKLMNEIKAEVNGRIVKIFLENGQPVEYGQEMFLVEKI